MSPRLIGAVLALVAAILLAVSMATSALWAGHPSVDGREIEKKTVYIGLLGGQGCNTGGDGTCEDLVLSSSFTAVSFVQLGTSSLFVLVALVLALTSFLNKDSRKSIGKGAIGVALLCVAVVLGQILIGPNIQTNHAVSVPIGYGMYLFLGAIITVVVGGLLAGKNDPPIALRPSRQPAFPPMQPPQPQQQIDVLALLQEDAQRPPPPQSPGGMLPGPAGPLGANTLGAGTPPGPMFNAPYQPAPSPSPFAAAPFPSPAATPFAAAPFASPAATPSMPRPASPSTPPSFGLAANRADTSQDPVIPAPPPAAPPPPAARTKAASVAPPPRVKAPSIPPPTVSNKSGPAKKLPAPGFSMRAPTALGVSVQAPTGTDPGQNTIAAGPAALAQANAPKLPADSPMQAFTGAAEPSEEVATRAVPKEPDLMVGSPISVGDSTDADRKLPDAESTDVNARPVTDDGEEAATVFRGKKDATPAPTTRLPTDDSEEAATVARPKQDPEDLATDAAQARASAKKIPISTASEALPPPKEEKTAHGGPQPACPQCEAPMNWVEEHLRFYCKSCRMYF